VNGVIDGARWGGGRRLGVGTAVTVLGVGALIGLTDWGRYGSDGGRLFVLDIVVSVVGIALLPVLPRWPVPATLALIVLAAVSPAATPPAAVGVLHVAWRRRFPVTIAVAGLGIVAHGVRDLWRPIAGLPWGWWFLLVVLGHATLVGWGVFGQARRALIASLCERAERAAAEQGRRVAEARVLERTRIAWEMYDVLAHRLSLLATYAGALEYRPDLPPDQLAKASAIVRAGAHDALCELRDVIAVLRDTEPTGDETAQRPQPVLADLPRLIAESQDTGVRIELRNQVADQTAPPATTGRTVYRVVQEALTNARKHATGQPVWIDIDGTPGARLTIDIRNPLPAQPVVPAAIPGNGNGTGLVGLTERVRLAGGQLDHQTTVGEFRLQAWLPWPA
jgi:signal transduction histidine kinase